MAAIGASSIDEEIYLLKIHRSGGTYYRLFPTKNGLDKARAALDADLRGGYAGLKGYDVLTTLTNWQSYNEQLAQKQIP